MRIRYSYQGTEKDFDTERREVVIGREKAGVAVDLDSPLTVRYHVHMRGFGSMALGAVVD
jgi:hypothetical protein